MTQLFIDSQEVALPEDFSFEFIRENPFFTKGGSFTLDISLNLDIPINARLYRHLNRFTASSKIKNRSARLIVDGRTVLNGTEIVLEVNELSASIQLASGNSELNFLVGSDVKMNTLDFGYVPNVTSNDAYLSLYRSYPEWNFVCAPVKAMNGSEPVFINNLTPHQIRMEKGKFILYSAENYPEEIRPMPYLNYIIEKCISTLGYSIGRNSIRDSIYNRLFIVHSSKPKRFSDLFQDETVAEFLAEVEKLFNVMIQVNEDKTIDILFAYEFYKNATLYSPKLVSEQFEKKYLTPDEQPLTHTFSNIRYDFDNTVFSKESDIDPDIRTALNEVRCVNINAIHNSISNMNINITKRSIFVDEETGQEFITKKEGESEHDYKLWPINTFKRISGKYGGEIEIKIVPANIELLQVDVCHIIGSYYYTGYLQIPSTNSFIGTNDETITAEEAIQGKTETSQSVSKISIAFNSASAFTILPKGEETTTQPNILQHANYPLVTTQYNAPWVSRKYMLLDNEHVTLAFNSNGYGLYDKIYSKAPVLDMEEEITMHAILDGVIPQATEIFIVNNKKFVCKDIHFKITPDGFDPEYQASLFPWHDIS